MAENSSEKHESCNFFLKRKNRYCKMIPGKGKKYCGEHSYLADGDEDSPTRKRIPCPLDTKHTVFEDQLEKHLKKCNVTKKRKVEYYHANINSGIIHTKSSLEELPLRKIPKADIQKCIDIINLYFKDKPISIKTSVVAEDCLESEINNMRDNLALTKHLHQQSSLIGNLKNANLLTSNTIFVEFGAGRGMLSHWIQKSMRDETNVDFLLVDRASTRYKADSYHRGPEQGPSFNRVQIDIQHLNLSKVPLIESEREITAVSKHLCGAATDLALRCLHNSCEARMHASEDRSTKRLKLHHNRVQGLLFALCCHHCCSWSSYVGREFMENLGISPYYFHILCCLSSWATCGSRKEAPVESKTDVSCGVPFDQRKTSERLAKVEQIDEKTHNENVECSSEMNEENDNTESLLGMKEENKNIQCLSEKKEHNGEDLSEMKGCNDNPKGLSEKKEHIVNKEETDHNDHAECSSEVKNYQEHGTVETDEGSCIRALGYSKAESEEIGRRSKHLLDAGRVWYLEQFGLDASLLYYVDRSISLENVALVARNKEHKVKKKD